VPAKALHLTSNPVLCSVHSEVDRSKEVGMDSLEDQLTNVCHVDEKLTTLVDSAARSIDVFEAHRHLTHPARKASQPD